jgi:hypothetical protein
MTESAINTLHSIDVTTGVWVDLSTPSGGEVPEPRSFHKMCANGNELYVFGGCAAVGRLSDLHSYNISTSTWVHQPAPSGDVTIAGRGGPSICATDSKFMVATGYSGQENDDVYSFDFATSSWVKSQASGKFRPRSVCAHSLIGSNFAVFGGEVSTSDKGHEGAGAFCNDLVLINSVTGDHVQVEEGEPRPPARGWTAMAPTGDGGAILFGGLAGDDEKPERLNDVWVLKLE